MRATRPQRCLILVPALLAGAVAGACTGDTFSARDATNAVADGGLESGLLGKDASTNAAGDAFCASNAATAAFCADFDLSSNPAEGWQVTNVDQSDAGVVLRVDSEDRVSPPHALLVDTGSGGADAFLRQRANIVGSHVRFGMHVRISRMGTDNSELIRLAICNKGDDCLWVALRTHGTALEMQYFIRNMNPVDAGVPKTTLALTTPLQDLNVFRRVVLDIDLGKKRLGAFVNEGAVGDLALPGDLSLLVAYAELRLGALFVDKPSDSTTYQFLYDNVLLEAARPP